MVDVPRRREGDGETERGKRQLPGSGGAKRRRRVCRNRLKIVEFLQISGGGRLLFPVVTLKFFTQEATALAGVSGDVLLLAEVSCDVCPVEGEREENDTIAETGERDEKKEWYSEYESHSAR
jgi:hypothetical protein